MARTFKLESGIKSSTPATRKFFSEVKDFTITMHRDNTVTFASVDGKKALRTTSIQNRHEINELLSKNGGQYVRFVTRNSVINVWSDTPNC